LWSSVQLLAGAELGNGAGRCKGTRKSKEKNLLFLKKKKQKDFYSWRPDDHARRQPVTPCERTNKRILASFSEKSCKYFCFLKKKSKKNLGKSPVPR
jgi:hypothetical protein